MPSQCLGKKCRRLTAITRCFFDSGPSTAFQVRKSPSVPCTHTKGGPFPTSRKAMSYPLTRRVRMKNSPGKIEQEVAAIVSWNPARAQGRKAVVGLIFREQNWLVDAGKS